MWWPDHWLPQQRIACKIAKASLNWISYSWKQWGTLDENHSDPKTPPRPFHWHLYKGKHTYVSLIIPLEMERKNIVLTHCRWVQQTKLMTLLFRDGHGSWAWAAAKWGLLMQLVGSETHQVHGRWGYPRWVNVGRDNGIMGWLGWIQKCDWWALAVH